MIAVNSSITNIELWFIPIDIFLIICLIIVILLAILFLLIIILDKTCHTIPMLLVANSCMSILLCGCTMLSFSIFTYKNDINQAQDKDSLCIFRGYIGYVTCALLSYSFLIQALYRYIIIIYPNRLFFQTIQYQFLIISLITIFCFLYPLVFTFNNEIIYNIDNQICQLKLQFSFSIIYGALCIYIIPVSTLQFLYFKLVRYVHQMSKRITPVNTFFHAQRELKMIRQTVILTMILVTIGLPYGIFIFISFFTNPPKYHFRIAFIFLDLSLLSLMIPLFQFTDPLKTSLMKRIKPRSNVIVVAAII